MVTKAIAVDWERGPGAGHVEVTNGRMRDLRIARGDGTFAASGFGFECPSGPLRLEMDVEDGGDAGEGAAIVTIDADTTPFSFFVRDVSRRYPIVIPRYGVAVTEAGDGRSYAELRRAAAATGGATQLQRIALEPEETFERASASTRQLAGPTWLGLGRDMRIFAMGFRGVGAGTAAERLWDWVQPRFHGYEAAPAEGENPPVRYHFMLGRGIGATEHISRRLDEGVLPILHARLDDGGILYHVTAFVSLERSALQASSVRGTHYLVADGYSVGQMFTPEQRERYERLLPAELEREEETVLYVRVEASNTTPAPRYAWFKCPFPDVSHAGARSQQVAYRYDAETGMGVDGASGQVFSVCLLNGEPMAREETAVLVEPGRTVTCEFRLPHRPLPPDRAAGLARQDADTRLRECRDYWTQKLDSATVRVPERRVEEMVQAGLLHLDLVSYGLEPDGTIAPTIGIYSPIGSESAPIIQFMDSMGWHTTAERALRYFLDKQHDDGFMQNFGGYMLETEAALWSLGEHFRYTRDLAWVRSIAPQVLMACAYVIGRRRASLREELRGKGYGLLEGKVADPEDQYRIFMLNGYAYLGLSRAAEMLAEVDADQAGRIGREAEALKRDLRAAFFDAVARSPVVPLGDGTWSPTAPPWVGQQGPLCLFAQGGTWYTHGTMLARDSLIGPLWLLAQEVVDVHEGIAADMLAYHSELMHSRNVAFSQPYYSPHPWAHLRRGEVKPFLKAYYNGVASLADRETYSFWEHYFHASPHKTHEEAWFLMQTRWMLYLEHGQTLKLLPGIPRAWLEDGKCIELTDAATYFGPLSVSVRSSLEQGYVEATIACPSGRHPARVELRIPHPDERRAERVSVGRYDPESETVVVEPFEGEVALRVDFR